jgi:ubiquinone/menaquinone biosynthesis C-methylase UbiE
MSSQEPLMFHELAPFYDRLLAGKNYRAEARRLEELARRFCRSGGDTWLDIACGTGRHLEYLRSRHRVMGLDRSREMLRVARVRLPGVRLVRADMRTFRLPQRFDVISCLFGAIGNVLTELATRQTIENFAAHVKPGGLLILEPWIDPAEFRVGMLRLMTYDDPSTKAVRLAFSRRRGNRSLTYTHFLVAEEGQGMRHWEEEDVRQMVPYPRLEEMIRHAGLRPRSVQRGLETGRPLLLGLRPT